MVSTGTVAAGFISMTEPSKLVERAIGRPNTTWNSVKQRAVAGVGASAVVGVWFQHEQLHVIWRTLTSSHANTKQCIKGIFFQKFSCGVVATVLVSKHQRLLVWIQARHIFFSASSFFIFFSTSIMAFYYGFYFFFFWNTNKNVTIGHSGVTDVQFRQYYEL